jgi:hypothetical protein
MTMKFDGQDPDHSLRKKFCTITDSSQEGDFARQSVYKSVEAPLGAYKLSMISPKQAAKNKNSERKPARATELLHPDSETPSGFSSD